MINQYQVIAVTAGLLTLFYVFLTGFVIARRKAARIPFKDGGDIVLLSRIRAHANFAEYVPLFLVLMLMAASQGLSMTATIVLCVGFSLGRFLHAFGVIREHLSQYRHRGGRTVGMLLTLLSLIFLAMYLLFFSSLGLA
ncbi:glutathione S-transferase [Legionella geestiana]|uniref:Glutathione S-transferase n=1 Tax=Legionella geestiana TaxID=45065 RepID=A0A0W0UAK4_9GAMM|nr:MAPEG family protein [Legionella geestiana]KTD04833.1 glutathione S-transferase [Legionella geestiana]QBS11337.1 hypothetical protein E4T54_00500 [Legionella geestiana]STX54012.1 glutathione S-transferase [Legionella geestiana]